MLSDTKDNWSRGINTPAFHDGIIFFGSNKYVGALKASNGIQFGTTLPMAVSPCGNGVVYDNGGG